MRSSNIKRNTQQCMFWMNQELKSNESIFEPFADNYLIITGNVLTFFKSQVIVLTLC